MTHLLHAERVDPLLDNLPFWQHDLCSCLQSLLAALLHQRGQDPTITLGACWDFYYDRRQFRPEEFFYPCRWPGVAESLAPYHPLRSRWHWPAGATAGWVEVREALQRGKPAIVAVDNYHLPFRPAYHDVHAAHLILVHGYDEVAGLVYVYDPMPPRFNGTIPLASLYAARGSANPNDGSDDFFASSPIAQRWLEIDIGDAFPAVTQEWIVEVLRANLERFTRHEEGPTYSGSGGLARYVADLCDSVVSQEGSAALQELYTLGWAIQAMTGLHADFLISAGQRLDWLRLCEIGRLVDCVAHDWTALRITGAHGRGAPSAAADQLALHSRRLLSDQQRALDEIARALKGR